jgi:hypothetical protein
MFFSIVFFQIAGNFLIRYPFFNNLGLENNPESNKTVLLPRKNVFEDTSNVLGNLFILYDRQ